MYFKENLCLRQIGMSFFPKCLLYQININNKKGYITVLYRSPSKTSFEFNNFQHNLDKILNDVKQWGSTFLIILVDFHAKSKTWWTHGYITTNEGVQIESLTSTYGLHQLISDPTHILPSSSSCIDLIFTNHPHQVVDSGVHPSLHPNCHHETTYCKFNLFTEYLPPYEQQVWDYKHADTNSIQKSLNQVNWNRLFQNKNVNEQVAIPNNIILNIFSNFVPNKILTSDERPPHGWLSI